MEEYIKFVNERVRPQAEKLRALKAEIDDTIRQWHNGISSHASDGDRQVDDGREAEGISRLDNADVTNFIGVLEGIQSELDKTGVADVVQKPCVRPLRVG